MVKNRIQDTDWPVITITDLEKTVTFFTEKLCFHLVKKEKDFCVLRLGHFLLELKVEKTYNYNELHNLNTKKNGTSEQHIEKNLYIPVEKLGDYYDSVQIDDADLLFPIKMLHYDFEAFGILFNEICRIVFFRDHHGPYNPNLWYWGDKP